MKLFLVRFIIAFLVPLAFAVELVALLHRIQFSLFWKLSIAAVFGLYLCSHARSSAADYFANYAAGKTDRSASRFMLRFSIPFLLVPPLGFLTDYLDWNYQIFIPTVSTLIVTSIGFLIARLITQEPSSFSNRVHLRGRELLTELMAKRLARERGFSAPGLSFAGIVLPYSKALLHFLVVGATGSGKTVTIRRLYEGIVEYMLRNRSSHTVVYDAKLDVIPYLRSITDESIPILDLHPFRSTAVAWDMAADIRTARDAETAALMLFPRDNSNSSEQEFFREAPRLLMEEVIRALQTVAPGNWTLRDVYILMTTSSLCRKILSNLPDADGQVIEFIQDFFEGDNRTTSNLKITIRSKFRRLRHIAAAWHAAQQNGRVVRLRDWARSGAGFLILGADKLDDSTTNAVNRLILTVLAKYWLEDPKSYQIPRHFLVLDEVQSAGPLDMLHKLLTEGREKGVSAILGFQAIGSMFQIYGQDKANALIGQCGNQAFLRMGDQQTADWASRQIGDHELMEITFGRSYSVTHGQQHSRGESTSVNTQIVRKQLVMPSEFMNLPVTNAANGLTGYYGVPEVGVWKNTTPSSLFPKRTANDLDTEDDVRSHELKPFDENDFARLGLNTPAKSDDYRSIPPDTSDDSMNSQSSPLSGIGRIELDDDD